LQSIAENGPKEIQLFAVQSLVDTDYRRNGGPVLDAKTRDLLRRVLQSNNVDDIKSALWLLLYYERDSSGRVLGGGFGGKPPKPQLVFMPELVPLLFHADESVRREARRVLQYIGEKERSQVIEQLLAVLDDASRKRDRIHALRAIAAIGPKAEPALEKLKQILATRDPKERIAAATAIKMILGKDQYQKPIADILGSELGITAVETPGGVWGVVPRDNGVDVEPFNKFNDDVIREQESLFPEEYNASKDAGGGIF
jgi:hypothetical protein